MADEVILMTFWLSPYGMRVRIALEEKGIKYEYKEEDFIKKSPLLLEMNPVHKKVPVLVHNGKPICESLIVVEYIDEVWNDHSPLLPSDPVQRAQARFWADYIDKKVYEIALRILKIEGEEKEGAKRELLECLKVLEEELGEKAYFGGEKFGLVDLTLVPLFCWFYTYSFYCNLMNEGLGEYPTIVAWAKRCTQRESVLKTFPEENIVKEFVMQVRKGKDTK